MTKNYKILSFCLAVSLFTSCSQVLQTVDLNINSKDNTSQEEFNVAKALTIKEADCAECTIFAGSIKKWTR